MKFFAYVALTTLPIVPALGQQAVKPAAPVVSTGLSEVKRIYVEPLSGAAPAKSLRDLIITGLDSTKLFILTDDPDRADAVLKGSADDKDYVNSFDTDTSLSSRTGGGIYGLTGKSTRSSGGYGAESSSEREAHHIKERKHEAYASLRLCNHAGDVIWSTTQESGGAKFRGASADVAMKVARQLALDFDNAKRLAAVAPAAHP